MVRPRSGPSGPFEVFPETPALSSSSHAMLASTAAATREKLNVGVSASAAGERASVPFAGETS